MIYIYDVLLIYFSNYFNHNFLGCYVRKKTNKDIRKKYFIHQVILKEIKTKINLVSCSKYRGT